MGCIASKHTVTITPAFDTSGSLRDQGGVSTSSRLSRSKRDDFYNKRSGNGSGESEDSRKDSSNETGSLSFRLSSLHRYIEGEQVAAGWPGWLTAVAGEAIQGWIPLKGDAFEKLEKIGQGTYSSVFRARDLESGKIVAMKKVRFDNLDPESVRFMAREIQILRRLDHPNIVKLEGLVTSRMSNSIYLVFEYMEHDFAGLLSSPDIKFSEAQVKCYMHQLLSGLEHCHSRGIMHRDIKGSNLLVNNEGILKIADFGLANFFSPGQRQPLTSRVVTLWYRPPELLLGSTNYVASVDLWSVGCVFAELLLGKPILQGRTEVEQLHKIFKLCGSPPEEYWKKSKLPHATIFKPQHPYHSSLRQLCKDLPPTTAYLIETFLSVEPYKRGTAKSALKSTYFTTKPYACEPSSLPKYPPNKEIDAKGREEAQRKGLISKGHGSGAVPRPARTYSKPEPNRLRLTTHVKDPRINIHNAENNNKKVHKDSKTRLLVDLQPVPEINPLIIPPPQDSPRVKCTFPGQVPFSGPLQVPSSSGFAWAKHRPEDNKSMRSNTRYSIKDHIVETFANSNFPRTRNTVDPHEHSDSQATSRESGPYRTKRRPFLRQWGQTGRPDSFDASDMHHTRDFSRGVYYMKDGVSSHKSTVNQDYYQDDGADKVEFSGPLLTQSLKVDELLQKNEKHIRQMMRRSWFQREQKHGK